MPRDGFKRRSACVNKSFIRIFAEQKSWNRQNGSLSFTPMKHSALTRNHSHDSKSGRAALAILVFVSAVVVFVGMILAPLPTSGTRPGYPSDKDAEALQFFHDHQADFERLRSLIAAYPALIYVHRDRRELIPDDAIAKATEEWSEIQGLMTRLKLDALNGPASDWGLRMVFWGRGLVTASTTRSFWFSDVPPVRARVFPSLDTGFPDTPGSSSAFREIVPNWYLRLDWGG